MIALGLFFSYALQFHVAVCYVWPDLKQKHGPFKNPFLAEYGVRVGLALITCKYYLYIALQMFVYLIIIYFISC